MKLSTWKWNSSGVCKTQVRAGFETFEDLSLGGYDFITVDMVCMNTFVEEAMEQEPRFRWLILQNHWKAVSREELGWGSLVEGRVFNLNE